MTARSAHAEHLHRMSRATMLRVVLSDGRWHTGTELVERVGHRFGASILTVSRGDDGHAPWDILRERVTSSGSLWKYRFVRVLEPEEVVTGTCLRGQVAALKAELLATIQSLSAANAQLEALGVGPRRPYKAPSVQSRSLQPAREGAR